MRFVADDQVPFAGAHELLLKLLVARQQSRRTISRSAIREGIARARGLDHVAGEDVEFEIEFLTKLVLPLLDEAARRDDQAALQVAAGDQLLDEQTGHDRLAGAGIVREQEAQRLTRQHLAIDGRNLVRAADRAGRVDGEVGVEEMRQTYTLRLRGDLEGLAIGVEWKGSGTPLVKFKPGFIIPEEDDLARTVRAAVDDAQRVRPHPVRAHDLDRGRTNDPPNFCARYDAFEPQHPN